MSVLQMFGYFLLATLLVAAWLALWLGYKWVAMKLGLHAPDYPPNWKEHS